MDKLKLVEMTQLKSDRPEFGPGDTVNVHVRVVEGDKERIQQFQGVVISKRGSGVNTTFTVRKISDGVGVERVFAAHSPFISEIEVMNQGVIRRSKLYYLRKLSGKKARIKARREI